MNKARKLTFIGCMQCRSRYYFAEKWLSAIVIAVIGSLGCSLGANAACTTWPNNLANGQTADANAVMSNFNYLGNCAAPLASPLLTGKVGIANAAPSGLLVVGNAVAVGETRESLIIYNNGTDRSFRITPTQNAGARNNYLLNNLQVDGTETTFTQGNWGASVGLKFNALGLDFLVNAKPVGGSTTIITPVDTMSLREGQVGIGTPSPDMTLTVNGNADKSSGGTAWSVYSDKRLKNITGPYLRGLADIVKLNPVRFHYRKNNVLHLPSDHEEVGVVAQDARNAFPETVTMSKRGYLEFNISDIQFAMINALKELKSDHEELSANFATAQVREQQRAKAYSDLKKENVALRAEVSELARRLMRLERNISSSKAKNYTVALSSRGPTNSY